MLSPTKDSFLRHSASRKYSHKQRSFEWPTSPPVYRMVLAFGSMTDKCPCTRPRPSTPVPIVRPVSSRQATILSNHARSLRTHTGVLVLCSVVLYSVLKIAEFLDATPTVSQCAGAPKYPKIYRQALTETLEVTFIDSRALTMRRQIVMGMTLVQ